MDLKPLTLGLILTVTLISGCVQQQQPAPATTSLICNIPYIQVGNECCLDENDDKICDKDKPITTLASTTILPEIPLLSTTTTTTITITTTTTTSLCKNNEDCGGNVNSVYCSGRSLYNATIRYVCKKPNTPDAFCMESGGEKIEIRGDCAEYIPICRKYNCPWGCYDNVQDRGAGEEGVDCGGMCRGCREEEIRYETPCVSDDDCKGVLTESHRGCSEEFGKTHVIVDFRIEDVCVNPGKPNSRCETKRVETSTGLECNERDGFVCISGECVYEG